MWNSKSDFCYVQCSLYYHNWFFNKRCLAYQFVELSGFTGFHWDAPTNTNQNDETGRRVRPANHPTAPLAHLVFIEAYRGFVVWIISHRNPSPRFSCSPAPAPHLRRSLGPAAHSPFSIRIGCMEHVWPARGFHIALVVSLARPRAPSASGLASLRSPPASAGDASAYI